jgi:hypothetical protein
LQGTKVALRLGGLQHCRVEVHDHEVWRGWWGLGGLDLREAN